MKGPYISDYFRYFAQLLSGARSQGEAQVAELRRRDVSPYLPPEPWKILDLANGRLRPQYALLRAAGHEVYGIDLINHPDSNWIDVAYRIARRLYLWRLGLPMRVMQNDSLVCGDVSALPFADAYFDLVVSMAAFEHFLDVPGVVKEVYRVLRPGGIVWVGIHPFTSPTGGHNVSFTQFPLRTLPRGVEPWDHLRKRRLPLTAPLNQWRITQYEHVFGQHFEILKTYCASHEGEAFLIPSIAAELAHYTREELTCATYVIMARKRDTR